MSMPKPALDTARLRDDFIRLLLMLAASTIIALNIKSFVRAGDLVPGGLTGLTLLIQRIAERFFQVELSFTAINFILNAIPVAISFRFIGKRFTIFSCVVIAMTSVLTDLFPSVPITDDVLLIAIFGGLINGCAISLCLLGRATSGGMDFVSIALSEQLNMDAWNYILGFNVVMLVISGALFGWDKALYSIIFQFTSTQTIKLLDSSNKRTTLFIVTSKPNADAVCQLVHSTHHGATLFSGTGLHDGGERVMIFTVVESRQVRALKRTITSVAPGTFINAIKTDQVAGRFYRKPRD